MRLAAPTMPKARARLVPTISMITAPTPASTICVCTTATERGGVPRRRGRSASRAPSPAASGRRTSERRTSWMVVSLTSSPFDTGAGNGDTSAGAGSAVTGAGEAGAAAPGCCADSDAPATITARVKRSTRAMPRSGGSGDAI